MAICLDYQLVHAPRSSVVVSFRMQVLAVLILTIALAGKLWTKIEATSLGYELARLQSEMIDLDMQRRELLLQRSVLLRPNTLASRAQSVLGLAPLDPSKTRRIPEP